VRFHELESAQHAERTTNASQTHNALAGPKAKGFAKAPKSKEPMCVASDRIFRLWSFCMNDMDSGYESTLHISGGL